jgi:16S rRNA (cytosine1402-N4)-methyltransferase
MPVSIPKEIHAPVMSREAIEFLDLDSEGVYVDATVGLGGHAEKILEISKDSLVIGIDRDREALRIASERLAEFGSRVKLVHGNFASIRVILMDHGVTSVVGILADLGVSSLQFDSESRGFSFRFDAPLDMRMDPDSHEETAAELLERLPEKEIADIIYRYGEERASRCIARRIVGAREIGQPVRTTFELVRLIERCVRRKRSDKIHPATRTFQALRIAVNREIDVIEQFLRDAIDLLQPSGRLVVITFHSLEDRIVKQTFQKFAGKCTCPARLPTCVCGAARKVEILTRKPVVADEAELARNPRSRSAKLRAVRKITPETPGN